MKPFKDKKVVIMGLGLLGGGIGAAKFFCKQGAKVLVTDLRTRKELKESVKKLNQVKFVLGKHRKEDFINADLIIRNPGVPRESKYLKIAKDNNIPVKTDIDIFFDLCPGTIIGITGTKGKSTVATLIYLFLKKKYSKTFLAGNIGVSPLEVLSKINKESKVVLELSSFELEDLKKSPHVAVITNLFPDHLDRYKNFKDYVNAKKSIFKYQNKNDILVLNKDSETKKLCSEAKSKVYFFKGSNVAAAVLVAELFKISKKDIKKVLSNFKGVPHRQEFVVEKKGVKYFNDTTATNPRAVIFAIETFRKRFPRSKIVLIAGGKDKKLIYRSLARNINNNVDYVVLLPGTGSNKLKKDLSKFYPVKSMKQAVKKASYLAQKGDIVLLSPGAASFNLFENEFDRGNQFVKAVKKL
jgi:UDP-N-acetylmuramoylalanine--D-glutamate ligase